MSLRSSVLSWDSLNVRNVQLQMCNVGLWGSCDLRLVNLGLIPASQGDLMRNSQSSGCQLHVKPKGALTTLQPVFYTEASKIPNIWEQVVQCTLL